jgi:putative radical SAM enzyme (TIGR03279 family)
MHGQIVLCRGINDGDELDRTMNDLCRYFPNLESMSVVPVGLTDYRDGLYPLTPFSREDCARVIEQIDRFAESFKKKYGSRLFFAADEFYIKAELPIPEEEYYEDYKQIENGVGMIRSHKSEFDFELAQMKKYGEYPEDDVCVSVVTGVAAYDYIKSICDTLQKEFDRVKINVIKVENRFFGERITVTGLLTGKDIYEQLKGRELGQRVLVSSNCLRSEKDLFLCGMSVDELEKKLGTPVVVVENDGCEFISAVLGRE